MSIDLNPLESESRLLVECPLHPIQSDRFQPTSFPDLGPATYDAPDGTPMLLVESAQSMANRLEEVCWDEEREDLIEPLRGLPYVHVHLKGGGYTNSLLEAHRLNSEYITGKGLKPHSEEFGKRIAREVGFDKKKPVPLLELHRVLFRYDPNSLVHGVFLEEIGGRLRVPRMLSAFVEARGAQPVHSGGVKFSRVEPGAREGEGNVPYSRLEYTAESITAFFNLDLAGIRGLGLPEAAQQLLILLSLLKIRLLLHGSVRLRTACDLDAGELRVTRPAGFSIPSLTDLQAELPDVIRRCNSQGLFADPARTEIGTREDS